MLGGRTGRVSGMVGGYHATAGGSETVKTAIWRLVPVVLCLHSLAAFGGKEEFGSRWAIEPEARYEQRIESATRVHVGELRDARNAAALENSTPA